MKHMLFPAEINNQTQHSNLVSRRTLYRVRLIMAIYTSIVIAAEIMEEEYAYIINLKYLTNWGVHLNFIYFWLVILNKNWQLAHAIYQINFALQFTITLIYWGAIYPSTKHPPNSFFMYWQRISEHGMMLLFMYVEFFMNSIRFYKRHLILLLLAMALYFQVNFCVTIKFGPVYDIIDFKSVTSAIYSFASVGLSLTHFLIGLLLDRKLKPTGAATHEFREIIY